MIIEKYLQRGERTMLMKCPECSLQVSDKAYACPHCGYPINEKAREPRRRKSNRRRRLPNGFGQISEIKGRNLRKPFRAMVPVGKTPEGRVISKLLKPQAYFETYNDAYAALVEYNRHPYELKEDITLEELYERWWKERKRDELSKSRQYALRSHWKYLHPLHKLFVSELKSKDVKLCIQNATYVDKRGKTLIASDIVRNNIRETIEQILDLAVEYELVDKNVAQNIKLIKSNDDKKQPIHKSFNDKEMAYLWSRVDNLDIETAIIIQCYSGWRPDELCNLKLTDVNLENWTFKGGSKTKNGIDRVVPIHSKIQKYVERFYEIARENQSDTLITVLNKKSGKRIPLKYNNYLKKLKSLTNRFDDEHTPHDPRVQFVTMAKRYKMDEYAIKYIVGHAIDDITEKTYTDRDIEWLKNEIETIK